MPKFSPRLLLGSIVLLVFGAIVALFVHDAQTPPTPVALPLTHTFDKSPTGFTSNIPMIGTTRFQVLAYLCLRQRRRSTARNPAPPSPFSAPSRSRSWGRLTKRSTATCKAGRCIRRGSGRSPVQPSRFNSMDATRAWQRLKARTSPGHLPSTRKIIATSSNNTFVYLVITTVPVSKRAALRADAGSDVENCANIRIEPFSCVLCSKLLHSITVNSSKNVPLPNFRGVH